MFNAEDQFRDDDHSRDSKDSSRRRDPEARYLPPEIRHLSSNGDVHARIRSPYGLSNDEARISSADLRPSAAPSSSRPPPTPSTSRTTSHGSAAIEPTAASALEKGRKDDSSDAESDVGSDEDLMLEKHGEGHGDGGMSNKAGIILVRSTASYSGILEPNVAYPFLSGHSQYLCRHPSVPRDWTLVDTICPSRAAQERARSRSRGTPCSGECAEQKHYGSSIRRRRRGHKSNFGASRSPGGRLRGLDWHHFPVRMIELLGNFVLVD